MVSGGEVEGHVRSLWPGVPAHSELYIVEIVLENDVSASAAITKRMTKSEEKGIQIT